MLSPALVLAIDQSDPSLSKSTPDPGVARERIKVVHLDTLRAEVLFGDPVGTMFESTRINQPTKEGKGASSLPVNKVERVSTISHQTLLLSRSIC